MQLLNKVSPLFNKSKGILVKGYESPHNKQNFAEQQSPAYFLYDFR